MRSGEQGREESASGLLGGFAERIHRWIRSGESPGAFDDLALELFRLQVDANAAYRRYVDVLGIDPSQVRSRERIPAVPTEAFKTLELTSLPTRSRIRVFHSSGTTTGSPSRHFHGEASLALYEASAVEGFRRGFGGLGRLGTLPDAAADVGSEGTSLTVPWQVVSMTPRPDSAPHSSLVFMIDAVGKAARSRRAVFSGHLDGGGNWQVDLGTVAGVLEGPCRDGVPTAVLGTAFNFVQVVEEADRRDRRFALPFGSRIMETGGYKGRMREWPRYELRAAISRVFGVPADAIVGEYGMSELSSQAYESALPAVTGRVEPRPCDGVSARSSPASDAGTCGFAFVPWARAVVVSPESGREVGDGETGLLRIFDLANVWSVMAVQTGDRAMMRDGTIRLLGRATNLEPRGCSLMTP